MVLKLPYIRGNHIQQWLQDRLNIKLPKRICQEIAIKARKAEKRMLGNTISIPGRL